MGDWSLTHRTDSDGRRWQICALCIEWVPYDDLAVDPTDGLRWDICRPCKTAEDHHSHHPNTEDRP